MLHVCVIEFANTCTYEVKLCFCKNYTLHKMQTIAKVRTFKDNNND